jgi:hypothetical protein
MSQPVPAVRHGGKAVVAAFIAALIAAFPATASAATAHWTIVPSPGIGTLADITCLAVNDCWAVGGGDDYKTLIEHNAGSGWVVANSPNPSGASSSRLSGLTCVSVSDCWAVGSYLGTSAEPSLIEHYNGSTWTIVTSADPGASANLLTSVRCVDASNCWAVGAYYTIGAHTLIEQYNGKGWVAVPGLSDASLQDVACLSVLGDCWAVGSRSGTACTTPGHICTLIEHNSGSGWVIVPSPDAATAYVDFLTSLTCKSASNCWAVGAYDDATKSRRLTLTEHYDGSSWAVVTSPNLAGRQEVLTGVNCATAGNCWAVGWRCCVSVGGQLVHRTLIEHNSGSGWVIVRSPNVSTEDSFLFGVKCVSTRFCWAVGGSTVGTLVMQHT